MKKKTALTILSIIAVVGSFLTFYFANLLLSDLSNMFYGVHDVNFISSLPGAFIICDLVLAVFFVVRLYHRPLYKKKMVLTYTKILVVFSVLGFVSSILTGTMIYDSFLAPYPFMGYSIILLIVHAFLIFLGIYIHKKARVTMDADEHIRKITIWYVLYTLLFSIVIYFALNRFGAFLWSPVYVHTGTFYLTWPFYLALLLPLAILTESAFYIFDKDEVHKNYGIIQIIVILVINIVLGIVVMYIGATNTQVISVISPALPIERLATKPIVTIFQHVLVLLIGIYDLIYAIRRKNGKVRVKRYYNK